jgi:xanthine dehydrogenase/oxidase
VYSLAEMDVLTFYVNGKLQVVKGSDPTCLLATYLRSELHLTGTKVGCGEGGCGACTVMISTRRRFGDSPDALEHFSCNACLVPLCSLDGCAVTTVEGKVTSFSYSNDVVCRRWGNEVRLTSDSA